LIIHIGFRKFWWISWILIFRPTDNEAHADGELSLLQELSNNIDSW